MEKRLYDIFKEKFIQTAAISIMIFVIVSILCIYSLFNFFNGLERMYTILFMLIIEAFVIAFCIGQLFPFFFDYKLVRKNKFQILDGIVVDFIFSQDATENPTTYTYPIIEDNKTGFKVRLNLDKNVKYEGHYLIYYLPKTKIGIVIKES